ncbi:hypothetical protein A9Q84_21305 [Halobacteriovorax marinus]|uniref:Lipoprotein n=1 Tax=Halobacteriovorax marinus TaxID=97084 RepID=A0A1Y5F1N0_9BACT|nr:hypothetical protein A9Q84_21305 [Halobacteriovorax marinus]
MSILKKIVYLLTAILVLSCFKQDVPEVSSDVPRTVRDFDQLKACSNVSYFEGFLERNNLLNLFVCSSWDLKFTKMFQALLDIPEENWNDLVRPIDAIFFADRGRRDRFINYYRDLDRDGALDDLGRVLTALTDTNYYDGLNHLFICADEPENVVCDSRDMRVSKEEVKNFFDFLNRDPKMLLELSFVIDHFHNALIGRSENLRREINKFNNTDFFNSLRTITISKFAEKYLSGLTDSDLRLIRRFFSTMDSSQDLTWIKSWLTNDSVNSEYLYELLSIPVHSEKQLVRDVKVLNSLYVNAVLCTAGDLELQIDIKDLVNNTLGYLKTNEVTKFYDSLLLASESIKYARPVCPEITDAQGQINYWEYSQQRNVNHTLDLGNALNYSTKLVSKEQTIEFLKYIIDLVEADYPYLMSAISGELFNIGNELNRVVLENSEPFYGIVLDIFKNSDDQIFKSGAVLLNEVFNENMSPDIAAWSKVWLFWNKTEQNFLFNFVDRHLDVGTDYVRLFSFYSLFMKEISQAWPTLREGYIKDEETKEQTYQAFKKASSIFHGEDILDDYKKFFSRDHVLKLLSIITSGQNYNASRIASLNLSYKSEFDQLPKRNFSLDVSGSSVGEKVSECVNAITEHDSLYSLIKNYPENCKSINSGYVLDDLTQGMDVLIGKFENQFPDQSVDHFFELGGLLSPEMTIWAIANAVSVNAQYKKHDRDIGDAFNFIEKYLYQFGEEGKKGYQLVKQGIDFLIDWMPGDEEKSFRNGLISEFVINKEKFGDIFDNSSLYLNDYDQWILGYRKTQYIEDEKYKCENFLNTNVGKNICPEKPAVKKYLKLLTKQLTTVFEESEGHPLEHILDAALPEGGVYIPLDERDAKKKRLTLLETFNYLFDLTDKNLAVNRTLVKHRKSLDHDKEKYELTTSERIDLVIREVAFGHNYLGVQYLNAVVKGEKYNKIVKSKKTLMQTCVRLPWLKCGKRMTKNETRMAKNALWAYDGLIDVNNGNDREKRLKYGKYMSAFLYSLVASSALDSQEVTFWPMDDKELKKHNGVALGYFSQIASFSNMGRVVHDRVGRTREQLETFVSKKQFLRVNDLILGGANPAELKSTLTQMVNILRDEDGEVPLDDIVDWIADLNYQDMRSLEELVSKTLYISTFLGSEKFVLGSGDSEKFKKNTVYESLYIATKFLRDYDLLKLGFPNESKLKSLISPALTVVSFLYDKLSDKSSRNNYWLLLNSAYAAIRESFYVRGGVELVTKNIIKPGKIDKGYSLVNNVHEYLTTIHSDGFSEMAEHLSIIQDADVGSDILWDYIGKTTVRSICDIESSECVENKTFDELHRLLILTSKGSNLKDFLDWFLIEKKESILKTSSDFFPFIKVKK